MLKPPRLITRNACKCTAPRPLYPRRSRDYVIEKRCGLFETALPRVLGTNKQLGSRVRGVEAVVAIEDPDMRVSSGSGRMGQTVRVGGTYENRLTK